MPTSLVHFAGRWGKAFIKQAVVIVLPHEVLLTCLLVCYSLLLGVHIYVPILPNGVALIRHLDGAWREYIQLLEHTYAWTAT